MMDFWTTYIIEVQACGRISIVNQGIKHLMKKRMYSDLQKDSHRWEEVENV